jgi:predicted outer membrane repeat protein
LFLVLAFCCSCAFAQPWNNIYVSPNGTLDANCGSSLQSACLTLKLGISNTADGGTVLLDDGVYFGSGNTNITFDGFHVLFIRSLGGSSRAIIDCQHSNVRAFTVNNEMTLELNGLGIVNCHALNGGAALHVSNVPTQLTLVNSRFENCTLLMSRHDAQRTAALGGAAIYIASKTGQLRASFVTFHNNHRGSIEYDGRSPLAMHTQIGSPDTAFESEPVTTSSVPFRIDVDHSQFVDAAVIGYGSNYALSISSQSFVLLNIASTDFRCIPGDSANTCACSLSVKVESSVNVTASSFSSCVTTAAYLWAPGSTTSHATFNNCMFTANSARDSGGAIYSSMPMDISFCNFTNNQAMLAREGGGAIYARDELSISQSVFVNNSATNGGAVILSVDSVLRHCVFVNNFALGHGGALLAYGNEDVDISLGDCVFSGNVAQKLGLFSVAQSLPSCACYTPYVHLLLLVDRWSRSAYERFLIING